MASAAFSWPSNFLHVARIRFDVCGAVEALVVGVSDLFEALLDKLFVSHRRRQSGSSFLLTARKGGLANLGRPSFLAAYARIYARTRVRAQNYARMPTLESTMTLAGPQCSLHHLQA